MYMYTNAAHPKSICCFSLFITSTVKDLSILELELVKSIDILSDVQHQFSTEWAHIGKCKLTLEKVKAILVNEIPYLILETVKPILEYE